MTSSINKKSSPSLAVSASDLNPKTRSQKTEKKVTKQFQENVLNGPWTKEELRFLISRKLEVKKGNPLNGSIQFILKCLENCHSQLGVTRTPESLEQLLCKNNKLNEALKDRLKAAIEEFNSLSPIPAYSNPWTPFDKHYHKALTFLFPGMKSKQINECWHQHLSPCIVKNNISKEHQKEILGKFPEEVKSHKWAIIRDGFKISEGSQLLYYPDNVIKNCFLPRERASAFLKRKRDSQSSDEEKLDLSITPPKKCISQEFLEEKQEFLEEKDLGPDLQGLLEGGIIDTPRDLLV